MFYEVIRSQMGVLFAISNVAYLSASLPSFSRAVSGVYNTYKLFESKPSIPYPSCVERTPFNDRSKFGPQNDVSVHYGENTTRGTTIPDFKGHITLKNVEFAYPTRPDQQVLSGLSLEAKPRQSIALVGSSGCGKSTVMCLLERLYTKTGGDILLDGVPLEDLDIEWLRSQISLVSQEPVLFGTSIRENILLGKPGATEDEVIAAAKMANAHTFISEFPDGYDTQVGEMGVALSGGQKQRVAIAPWTMPPKEGQPSRLHTVYRRLWTRTSFTSLTKGRS